MQHTRTSFTFIECNKCPEIVEACCEPDLYLGLVEHIKETHNV